MKTGRREVTTGSFSVLLSKRIKTAPELHLNKAKNLRGYHRMSMEQQLNRGRRNLDRTNVEVNRKQGRSSERAALQGIDGRLRVLGVRKGGKGDVI